MAATLKKSAHEPRRTTITLSVNARQIAERHAQARRISFGEALSKLVEEAEANRPQTRLETRDGWPVFVTPPGTLPIDPALIRKAIEEDW